MSLPKVIVKLILLSTILTACTPTKVPLNFSMDAAISIESSKVKEAAQEIYKILKEIKLDPICLAPFGEWLKGKFDNEGLMPKRRISPTEYGVTPAIPDGYKCQSIDIEKEFTKAVEDASVSEAVAAKGYVYDDLSKWRERMEKGGALADFFNEDNRKIEILGMNIEVSKNNLNVTTEPYKIYLTTKNSIVDQTMLEERDSEAKLLSEGKILLMGETPRIPPGFNGTLPVKLVENFDDMEAVRRRFVAGDASLIFMPPRFNPNPEIKTIGNLDYFVIPSGSITLNFSLKLSVGFEVADAWKEWERQKKIIRNEG